MKEDEKKIKSSEVCIEVFPAEEGDSILITLEGIDKRVLIDGGTAATYRNVLRYKLVELNNKKKSIDLLIVTHIDNDHIGGIIELLKENGTAKNPQIISIKNIWHNSYRHLQIDKVQSAGSAEKQILKDMISGISNEECCLLESNKKEISAIQGSTLAAWILKGGYTWNEQFKGNAVSNSLSEVNFGEDCTIKVLLPGQQELANLARKWRHELLKKRISFNFAEDDIFDDAYEVYCRYLIKTPRGKNKQISSKSSGDVIDICELASIKEEEDDSETNLASISILLEYRGKKILMLADNVADHIVEKLNHDQYFDAIKIPHHGSSKNISNDFLEKYYSENYLISTSSAKYGHPDISTLAKIVNCKGIKKTIYFNYEIQKIKDFAELFYENKDIEVVFLKNGQKIIL
ncbi:MBL fold metallo-hydrolase [Lacrimispora celerecrescens]|uniref:MBL fold metallo-hydrolase n=1 Tax=Lacrimispora celerecrescens TaxID=29354 RepID=UPI0016449757|nr:MBL fold metallo-hydrolase [Lacrimispora celerecrescens]